MTDPELVVEFASEQALDDRYESELRHGGAFVAGAAEPQQTEPCELVLVHPADGARLRFRARGVWQGEREGAPGVGVAIEGFGPEMRESIEAFIEEHRGAAPGPRAGKPSLHERVRSLSSVEQARLARDGDLSERVLLERIYGKAVWEPLLRNPRLTPPEVARIARMGTAPTPLIEQIAANASWLQSGPVRRALLANPRLGREGIAKVLRAMPKAELKLVPKQTAYSGAVRQVAKRMLGG